MRFILLLVFLCSLALGCGGGGGGAGESASGSTGGASVPSVPSVPSTPSSASVVFQFARAQSVLTVPSATARLRILFFSGEGGEGALLLERVVDFAPTVRIEGVPVTARSVRISALDTNGTPLLWTFSNISLTASQENSVSWTFHQPVVAEELLLPNSLMLSVGAEQNLPLTLRLSDQSVVQVSEATWSVDNGNLVVTSNGRITALSVGTSIVTARVGELQAQTTVEVTPQVIVSPSLQSISTDPETVTFSKGSKLKLSVLGTFSNDDVQTLDPVSRGITFLSDDPNVISVEADGTLTAEAEGMTQVRVGAGDLSFIVKATVEPPETPENESPLIILESPPGKPLPRQKIGVPFSLQNVQVTDDQTDFAGGLLVVTLRTTSLPAGAIATLSAPQLPQIGTVTGEGSAELTVALSTDATPATVEAFLEAVTIEYQGSQSLLNILVDLDDGRGGTFRSGDGFSLRGETIHLSINRNSPASETNFHTIQEAVDVAIKKAGPGSTITVSAGDYRAAPNEEEQIIQFGFAELGDVTIQGANAGLSAAKFNSERTDPTIWPPTSLSVLGLVTFDGIDFVREERLAPTAGVDGSLLFIDNSDARIENCVFRSFDLNAAGIECVGRDAFTLTDNLFEGGYSGLNLSVFTYDFKVSQCRFLNTPVGAYLGDSLGGRAELQNCYFEQSCDTALQLTGIDRGDPYKINNNIFLSPTIVKIDSFSTGVFDLTNNWWGQSTGPLSNQIEGTNSSVQLLVDPFLTTIPTFP